MAALEPDALIDALTAHYGSAAPAGPGAGIAAGPDPWRALVSVLLDRETGLDPRRALDAMTDAGLLEPEALAGADVHELADALKSSGIKGKVLARSLGPVIGLARWLVERFEGAADSLRSIDPETLRAELARINGIGPATADALLLLALGRPVYPLDRSTYRILVRHGWIDAGTEADEARAAMEVPARGDAVSLARLSDGFARVGRDFCTPRAARCERCPLRGFLPEGGPIEPE